MVNVFFIFYNNHIYNLNGTKKKNCKGELREKVKKFKPCIIYSNRHKKYVCIV